MARREIMAREVERTMRSIFRRCVECQPQTPTCPACRDGAICSLVPQSCDSCAYMVCIANPNPSPPAQKTNVGAVAGGVVGGLIFIGLAVFFFWRYGIRKRRQIQERAGWEHADDIATRKGFSAMRGDNSSTRTRGSVAASFLSRASNIIQIAYIPGVTNRNGSGHNSLAPVPPIPAAYAQKNSHASTPKSPLSGASDALFFRPSDLRDSSWFSDSSSLRSGKRDTQYTTHSITPSLARSSVMSEVYKNDATAEPMPATQIVRALPKMVSVKTSSGASSPHTDSSPTAGNKSGNGVKAVMLGEKPSGSKSPSSQHSGGTYAKAKPVTIGSKSKGLSPSLSRQTSDASTSSTIRPRQSSPLIDSSAASDDEDEQARTGQSPLKDSSKASSGAPSPSPLIQPLENPFFDSSDSSTIASSPAQGSRPNPYAAMSASVGAGAPRPKRNNPTIRGVGGLSAVIEEAAKRASEEPKWDMGPFSDEAANKK